MADDEDDFFGYSSPIAIGASMRETAESMTVHDELCKEVDQVVHEEASSRRRKRRNYDVDLDHRLNDLDDDIEILSSSTKQPKKQQRDDDQIVLSDEEEDDDDDDDSFSPSLISYEYTADSNTIKLLQAAEFASYNLKNSAPLLPITPNTSANTSAIDTSLVCSPEHKLTLRVRCQGVLHKVTIDESDELSCLISELADTLNKSPDQILLQFKSNDIDTTSSPKELNLSSVDILDAFVLDKSAPTANQKYPKSEESSFKIKIQSSQKTFMIYSIDKDKPLEPILCKFAAELGYARKDVSFWFDGEKIRKNQSPEDLDMENNDVIDANIIKKKK